MGGETLDERDPEYHDCEEDASGCVSAQPTLEINAKELNAMDVSKYKEYSITVHSGAGASVADPKQCLGVTVVDSPGSIQGQKYVGPGGELIPNEGQFTITPTLEDGRTGKFTYQVAKVRSLSWLFLGSMTKETW